jgi:hypothetical protein
MGRNRNCPLASRICLAMANRSKLLRAQTVDARHRHHVAGARAASILRSSLRSLCTPVTFSR